MSLPFHLIDPERPGVTLCGRVGANLVESLGTHRCKRCSASSSRRKLREERALRMVERQLRRRENVDPYEAAR